jgi:hypothetical protein
MDSGLGNVKYKYSLKVYYNLMMFSDDITVQSKYNNNIIALENSETDIGHVSAAFAIKKSKSIHEIELSRINLYKVDGAIFSSSISYDTAQISYDQKSTVFNLNIKYEYIRRIINIKDKLDFMFGVACEPYLESIRQKPEISTSFRSKRLYLGSRFYLIPRGTYSFNKRFYLDLNFPVEILDLHWIKERINNPALPENIQKNNKFYSNFFDKTIQIRIGVGIRI